MIIREGGGRRRDRFVFGAGRRRDGFVFGAGRRRDGFVFGGGKRQVFFRLGGGIGFVRWNRSGRTGRFGRRAAVRAGTAEILEQLQVAAELALGLGLVAEEENELAVLLADAAHTQCQAVIVALALGQLGFLLELRGNLGPAGVALVQHLEEHAGFERIQPINADASQDDLIDAKLLHVVGGMVEAGEFGLELGESLGAFGVAGGEALGAESVLEGVAGGVLFAAGGAGAGGFGGVGAVGGEPGLADGFVRHECLLRQD